MNKKSQLQFAHRCGVLMESGISLSETLSIMINMEKSRKDRVVLNLIKENVEKGVSLSKSITLSKAKFDPTLLSMIAFGEDSGILALSLKQGLQMMEKGNEIKKKLLGALVYPTFIGIATIGMTLFLVMYIFPKIIPLFSSMNVTLPLLTRAVRAMYGFTLQYGLWAILFIIVISLLFAFLYKKNLSFRSRVQVLALTSPILGHILQKYFISGFCRSIATLLECGQTLPVILKQITTTNSPEIYKKAWLFSHEEITRGISISESLQSFHAIFPSIVPDMLSIGERTGTLTSMFERVSLMYEDELETFIKQLSTSIEPILMIGMGVIVGSVALSIILPIYEITNHLSH